MINVPEIFFRIISQMINFLINARVGKTVQEKYFNLLHSRIPYWFFLKVEANRAAVYMFEI